MHTYWKREREGETLSPSLRLSHFSTSFFLFFFFSFILSLNQHLILLLLLLLFFFTRTFNIHSCEFTRTYIHRSLLRCIFTERLIYTIPLSIAASSTIWFGIIIWSRCTRNYGSSNINMIRLKETTFISIKK